MNIWQQNAEDSKVIPEGRKLTVERLLRTQDFQFISSETCDTDTVLQAYLEGYCDGLCDLNEVFDVEQVEGFYLISSGGHLHAFGKFDESILICRRKYNG